MLFSPKIIRQWAPQVLLSCLKKKAQCDSLHTLLKKPLTLKDTADLKMKRR